MYKGTGENVGLTVQNTVEPLCNEVLGTMRVAALYRVSRCVGVKNREIWGAGVCSICGSCYWGCIFKICLTSRWAAALGVGGEVVLCSLVSHGGSGSEYTTYGNLYLVLLFFLLQYPISYFTCHLFVYSYSL